MTIREQQNGFMLSMSTTDAMFALRSIEKEFEFVHVDLQNA